ncbi:MAG: hypothetical protein WCO44_12925 [Bacteroidota bacterium]
MTANSNAYFLPYEQMIRSVIYKYLIETGYFPNEEADELYQEMALWMITRKDKILGSYKGLAKFSTYLYTIVYYKCLERMRTRVKEREREPGNLRYGNEDLATWFGNIPTNEISPMTRLILNEYSTRLSDILKTYRKKQHKISFCLKSLFRLLVAVTDLHYYKPDEMAVSEIKRWIARLNILTDHLHDQEILALLTSIFNLLEDKQNSKDAIRKWMDDRQDEIIVLLNGNPPSASFTRETLQLLFEYYCKNQEQILQN